MVTLKRTEEHRNYIYLIEKNFNGKWGMEWDFSAAQSYEVAEMIFNDSEKYNKTPGEYRIVMYVSEKPSDQQESTPLHTFQLYSKNKANKTEQV